MVSAVRNVLICTCTIWFAGCLTFRQHADSFDKQEWSRNGLAGHRLSTQHFDIFTTLRDEEFEAALPSFVEAAYRRYEKLLPSPTGRTEPLVLYVFGLRPEWEAFTRGRFPVRFPVYRRIRNGGYTEGDVSALFYRTRASTLATIAHEGWHQYVSSRYPQPLPAWLNEGLACCFEAVDFSGKRPRFDPKHNTFRITSLREAVQQDALLSLEEIVNTDVGQILGRGNLLETEVYYAQVWALITFLRYGANGRYRGEFDSLLQDIANDTLRKRLSADRLLSAESSPVTLDETVFRLYFNFTPRELEDEYYNHVIKATGF